MSSRFEKRRSWVPLSLMAALQMSHPSGSGLSDGGGCGDAPASESAEAPLATAERALAVNSDVIAIALEQLPRDLRVASIATNADASRVYLGVYQSSDVTRRNLVVVRTANLGTAPAVSFYPEIATNVSVPTNTPVDVNAILFDGTFGRLYLANGYTGAGAGTLPLLTIYRLDGRGDPTNDASGNLVSPTSYFAVRGTYAWARIASLALFRAPAGTTPAARLYLGGYSGIDWFNLDATGLPTTFTNASGVTGPVTDVHTAPGFLYSGRNLARNDMFTANGKLYTALGNENVQILPLTATGARAAGTEPPVQSALIRANTDPCKGVAIRLARYPATGPVATLVLRPWWTNLSVRQCAPGFVNVGAGDVVTAGLFTAPGMAANDLAIDPATNGFILTRQDTKVDAITGQAVVTGSALALWASPSFAPSALGTLPALGAPLGAQTGREIKMLATAPNGRAVVLTTPLPTAPYNATSDYRVSVRVQSAMRLASGASVPVTTVNAALRTLGDASRGYANVFPGCAGALPWVSFLAPGTAPSARCIVSNAAINGPLLPVGPSAPFSDWVKLDDLRTATGQPVQANVRGEMMWQIALTAPGFYQSSAGYDNAWDSSLAAYTRMTNATVDVRVALGDPTLAATKVVELSETVDGGIALILVPGYAYDTTQAAPEPATPEAAVMTMSQRAAIYANWAETQARDVGPFPGARPRSFIMDCRNLDFGQGSRAQLDAYGRTFAALGCNGAAVSQFGAIPSAEVLQALANAGVTNFELASYDIGALSGPSANWVNACAPALAEGLDSEPAEFSYQLTPNQLTCWAEGKAFWNLRNSGIAPDLVTVYQMDDETTVFGIGDGNAANTQTCASLSDQSGVPNSTARDLCDTKTQCGAITKGSRCDRYSTRFTAAFQAFCQASGLPPQAFGAPAGDVTFANVAPLLQSAMDTRSETSRRLAYYTLRFFAVEHAQLAARAATTLKGVFPNLRAPYMNWNNYTNNWTPGLDAGGPDWFEAGRQGAGTLWTEDYIENGMSYSMSYLANLLRSADSFRPAGEAWGIGAHSVPAYYGLGRFKDAASYKLLAFVGRGAKTMELYQFGPSLFESNGWADNFDAYRPLAEATQRIGAAESLLFPGRPVRGNVAIQVPGVAGFWESPANPNAFYRSEPFYLYYALMHAGYAVDLIDDETLANAATFAAYHYQVIFLTQPNLDARARDVVRTWVQGGGTLVVAPGAATRDELGGTSQNGRPGAGLDDLLGLDPTRPRQPVTDTAKIAGARWVPIPQQGAMLGTVRSVATQASVNVPATLDGTPIYGVAADTTCTARGLFTAGSGPTLRPATGGATILANVRLAAACVSAAGTGDVAAMTVHEGTAATGRGRAIALGYWPGVEYAMSANLSDVLAPPTGWSPSIRQLATLPIAPSVTRPVRLADASGAWPAGIEALRLDSEEGTAVVLLDWFKDPTLAQPRTITVTVPNVQPWRPIVRSIESCKPPKASESATCTAGTLLPQADGTTAAAITIALDGVDIVMVGAAPETGGN